MIPVLASLELLSTLEKLILMPMVETIRSFFRVSKFFLNTTKAQL